LLLFGNGSAEEKVAIFLVSGRNRLAGLSVFSETVPLPMRRQDIADFLGLKLETVSRTLAKLERKNVIRIIPKGVFLIGPRADAFGYRQKLPATHLRFENPMLAKKPLIVGHRADKLITIRVQHCGTSAMARPVLSSHLSPDELKKLAETQIAQAMQIETGLERLGVLTVADALMNLAEIGARH
jgi:hypothetical protein